MQNKDREKGIEGVRVGLENEVSEMDRKGKNENLQAIQTNFSKNKVNIMQNKDTKRGTEGIRVQFQSE